MKIGQEIVVEEDFQLSTFSESKKINLVAGDKGVLDTRGKVIYITGEAAGRIHDLYKNEPMIIQGYDTQNIASLVSKRLNNVFMINSILLNYGITPEDLISEIQECLDMILR